MLREDRRGLALVALGELDRLPEAAQSVLRALSWQKLGLSDPPDRWLTRLRDTENHGEVRPEIEEIIDALVR